MNNFELVSKILRESDMVQPQQVQPANVKNDPAIIRIKKRAEAIRAKADLMGAHNQIKKVKIDSAKIDAVAQDHAKEMEKKAIDAQRIEQGMQ